MFSNSSSAFIHKQWLSWLKSSTDTFCYVCQSTVNDQFQISNFCFHVSDRTLDVLNRRGHIPLLFYLFYVLPTVELCTILFTFVSCLIQSSFYEVSNCKSSIEQNNSKVQILVFQKFRSVTLYCTCCFLWFLVPLLNYSWSILDGVYHSTIRIV